MRRMMGGADPLSRRHHLALLFDDELWFKADAETQALWDAEGCERFTFSLKTKRIVSEIIDARRRTSMTIRMRCVAGRGSPLEAGARSAARRSRAGAGRRAEISGRAAGRRCGAISGLSSIEGRKSGSARRCEACS